MPRLSIARDLRSLIFNVVSGNPYGDSRDHDQHAERQQQVCEISREHSIQTGSAYLS